MKNILLFISAISLSFSLYSQDIFTASSTGNLDEIKEYVRVGGNLDTTNSRGFTPLILAVYNDPYELATFLLEKEVNVGAQDASGNTALMGAAFKGNVRMTELLLKYGANVNIQNFNAATALIFASTFGQVEISTKLKQAGADLSIKDKLGKTALDHANMQENLEMIELLSK